MNNDKAKAEILDWCSQRVECLARRKIIDQVGTLDVVQSSPETETLLQLVRNLRAHRIMCDGGNGNVYDIADDDCEQAADFIEMTVSRGHAPTPALPPVDEVARIMWECDHDGSWSDPHDGQDESKVIYAENASVALEFIRAWSSDTSTLGNGK